MSWLFSMDERFFYALFSLAGKKPWLDRLFQGWASFPVYLVPFLLVGLWLFYLRDRKSKEVILFSTLAGLLAWRGLALGLGLIFSRSRPFVSRVPGKELLFHRPDYSFPSDHAALFFGLATSFWLFGWRKMALFLVALGLLSSLARVISGLHFPSDVLAGGFLGFLAAFLIYLLRRPLRAIVVRPLLALASRFAL